MLGQLPWQQLKLAPSDFRDHFLSTEKEDTVIGPGANSFVVLTGYNFILVALSLAFYIEILKINWTN